MKGDKRICFVVSGDLWGGAEAQVYQLARCLVENNYKVFVITLNKGILFDKFGEMPAVVTCFEENKMTMLATIFKIRSFLKTNKISLVHCHGFKENLLAGIAGKMFVNCKVLRTHHGRGVVNVGAVKSFIEKFNARVLTHKIIAVSYDLKAYLTTLGYLENNIDVVHNGVDCRTLSVSRHKDELLAEYSIPAGSFIIGTASRIEREKGFEYLLLSVKELIDAGLPIVFVIVGSGNLINKYKDMVREMDIVDSVIFTGFQEDVCSYLNMFDLFIMMSLNEGVPIALIEAMCMKKAIVSSEVGGIPEVVVSGVNGVLVPSMDHQSCASACKEIFSQESLKLSLGENAHKHVTENFSAEKSAEKTIKIYEGLLVS